jgi:hypothetical protein
MGEAMEDVRSKLHFTMALFTQYRGFKRRAQDKRTGLPIRQHLRTGSILSLSPAVDQMLAFHTIAQQCAHGAQTFKQGC